MLGACGVRQCKVAVMQGPKGYIARQLGAWRSGCDTKRCGGRDAKGAKGYIAGQLRCMAQLL
eukprot:1149245-Pelagomonas_calceolata.AAC.2